MIQDLVRSKDGKLRSFRWQCMDGRVLTLEEMKTSHIFNSMKMVFNHLAEAHGGEPVWFLRHYDEYDIACAENPQTHAELVMFFILEIERRGDLPDKYRDPYSQIVEQIFPMHQMISAAVALIAAPATESQCI